MHLQLGIPLSSYLQRVAGHERLAEYDGIADKQIQLDSLLAVLKSIDELGAQGAQPINEDEVCAEKVDVLLMSVSMGASCRHFLLQVSSRTAGAVDGSGAVRHITPESQAQTA